MWKLRDWNNSLEKRCKFNLEMHIAFIDFEKVFDKIDCIKQWNILYKRNSPPHLLETIKCLYNSNIMQILAARCPKKFP
jgi:hypothetical protein